MDLFAQVQHKQKILELQVDAMQREINSKMDLAESKKGEIKSLFESYRDEIRNNSLWVRSTASVLAAIMFGLVSFLLSQTLALSRQSANMESNQTVLRTEQSALRTELKSDFAALSDQMAKLQKAVECINEKGKSK